MKKYLTIASVLLLIVFLVPITSVSAASGIFYIRDDATGGACTSIGIWNPDTKECTLTTDITGSIQILSDNITLNGDGHSVIGGYDECGINLDQRTGVIIKNLTVKQIYNYGICVRSSNNITITDNMLSNNRYSGAYIIYSNFNTISNNLTSNNTWGIDLYSSNNNVINNNITSGNGYTGIRLSGSSDNSMSNNSVLNNGIGVEIRDTSDNNTLEKNTFSNNNYQSLNVSFSTGNTLTGNIFSNTISRNNTWGALYYFANNSTVTRNTFYGGYYGLGVDRSNNTQIYNNSFIDNTVHLAVWDGSGNVFNLAAPIGGNYWSNYDTPAEGCNNLNGDNFCDASYQGRDRLPWTLEGGWLNQPPLANAGGPYSIDEGSTITLDASASTDPDNNISYYEWDLDNDGLYDDAGGVTTTISFTQIGDHIIGLRVTDDGGLSGTDTSIVTVTDPTPPAISPTVSGTWGNNDWYTSDVTISWDVSDPESGIAFSDGCDATTLTANTAGATLTCSATNGASLSNSASVTVKIDKTAPTLIWVGGIDDGDSYYFGSVPPAPTCEAFDSLSGMDGSCAVTGYATTVGVHTLAATAKDNAGNQATETRNYSVLPWMLKGFYQPVDMNGIYNIVKNGSTVPLKFEIFAGSIELTDIAYIKSLTYAQTSCDVNATTDDIETTATGSTSLRYDPIAGQFIYNWKTPSTAGKCYRITLTTIDGSTLVAYFKLK